MENTYGNHSCNDCKNKTCPISEHSDKPNGCSFYWPPMGTTYPGEWYYRELDSIAEERKASVG